MRRTALVRTLLLLATLALPSCLVVTCRIP